MILFVVLLCLMAAVGGCLEERKAEISMPIFPGRGGDEGEEGKYADIAREPRRSDRPPVLGDTVKDILRNPPRDRGMRPVEIAEELGRRISPTEAFSGKHKRDLQASVKAVLRTLGGRGEIEREGDGGRRATFYKLVGGAGPSGFEVHRPSARTQPIQDARRIEPGRGSDPATWGEDDYRRRRRARNLQRRQGRTDDPSTWTPEREEKRQTAGYSQRTDDPMTWGIKPETGQSGRTADPMTWGQQNDPPANKGGRTADPMTWGNNDTPPDDDGGGKNASGGDGKIPW